MFRMANAKGTAATKSAAYRFATRALMATYRVIAERHHHAANHARTLTCRGRHVHMEQHTPPSPGRSSSSAGDGM